MDEKQQKMEQMMRQIRQAYQKDEATAHTPLIATDTPLKDRLNRPRSIFTPGHRIVMNIVPMFLNIFVPWGVFLMVLGVCSFWIMYSRPRTGMLVIIILVVLWLISVAVALERKRNDAEPTWYIYFALAFGIAILAAYLLGSNIYNSLSLPFYMVKDLKVLANVNPMLEKGQNVMDAGMLYFVEGSNIDPMRTWHFKQKTVYCAAPIIKGSWPAVPDTQSFDFWAVGKDCCSTAASDFRCGAFNNPLARSGIRILDDADRPFYRLAVEQAASLYGILSEHPVFFEWVQDPMEIVDGWNEKAFENYVMYVIFAFVVACFGVVCASVKFSWIGRAESIYAENIVGDDDWKKGGPQQTLDLHTHVSTQ